MKKRFQVDFVVIEKGKEVLDHVNVSAYHILNAIELLKDTVDLSMVVELTIKEVEYDVPDGD